MPVVAVHRTHCPRRPKPACALETGTSSFASTSMGSLAQPGQSNHNASNAAPVPEAARDHMQAACHESLGLSVSASHAQLACEHTDSAGSRQHKPHRHHHCSKHKCVIEENALVFRRKVHHH